MFPQLNRSTWILTPLSALLFSISLPAAELDVVESEEVGMSTERLEQLVPAMQKLVDDKKVAGAITIVARKGKIVSFEAVGSQNIAADKPMRTDTIVRIYSMTKPITSVATMMLVEEGKLALDDPLSRYLPELRDVRVLVGEQDGELLLEEPNRAPTVRDLLRHTAGLTYGIFGNTSVDQQYRQADVLARGSTLAEMIEKLGDLPLLYQPGTRFNYSVSTDVLGRLVEIASGRGFDEFLRERIFIPLDMHDTGFSVPDEKIERFAANYGPTPEGGLRVVDAPLLSRYRSDPRFLSGGGGLVSTARDYLRFCQMLLNRGELDGNRLLREETVEAMTKNQLPDEAYPIGLGGPRPGVGFGLGFSVVVEQTEYTRRTRVGEYGWGGAASTHFWISPADQLAVVALTQLMPFNSQMEQAVKPLVYDAILPEADHARTKAAVADRPRQGQGYRQANSMGGGPAAIPASGRLRVFVLAGQSNMTGQGRARELTAPLNEPHDRIRLWANGRWEYFVPQQNFGPGVFMAHQLTEYWPGDTIGIIKVGIGGTGILAFSPAWTRAQADRSNDGHKGDLYQDIIDAVAAAREVSAVELAGFVWLQGGKDMRWKALAEAYYDHLARLIGALRQDLESPELLVVLPTPLTDEEIDARAADRAPPQGRPGVEEVLRAKVRAAREIPNVVAVYHGRLPTHKDGIHFNTEGQLRLGKKVAEAVQKYDRERAEATIATEDLE